MKLSPDTEINTFLIDILIIKWLVFLLRSSFFSTIQPLASSDATAYTSNRPDEQTTYHTEIKGLVTMDINPSLQILGSFVKGTGSVKGLCKNKQKE